MKRLATITHDGQEFDAVILEIVSRFNELKNTNLHVEYRDINIVRGLFGRFWVVLVYEHDDTISASVTLPEPTNIKSTHIGMMPGLDPADPDWREKQALWEASQKSQEPRGRTEIQDS